MSPTLLVALIIVASVAAWGVFIAYVSLVPKRASHKIPVPVPEGVETEPVPGAAGFIRTRTARRAAEDLHGVSRRQFLNRAWGTSLLISLAQFSMASLDFLYPRLKGGFGAKIEVTTPSGKTNAEDIRDELIQTRTPIFIADGRFFLAPFEGSPEDAAAIPAYKAAGVDKAGIMALYRKCVHLGCSVPWCAPAKWFECPCHGSKYSINGEYRDGPAPRSLDLFRIEIKGGKVVVDTATIIQGAPRGTVTSQPQPEGIHCVEIGGE